eukprot:5364810-Pyramimonas_sp.AAC.1
MADLWREVSCDHQVEPDEMGRVPRLLRIYDLKVKSVRDQTDSFLAIRRCRRRRPGSIATPAL